jgi:serine phosphatase RsbU (regulator of sigma subunit)
MQWELLPSMSFGTDRVVISGGLEPAYEIGGDSFDYAIAGQLGASQFATAVIARLDIGTGRLRWISAGHLQPLIVRGLSLVRPPHCPPSRPLGLQAGKPPCCETRLEPGDRLVLYTDGITEARSPAGEFFGDQRLADFISAAAAAGQPAPETVRRLMRHVLSHQADRLQDDASIVVLEWRTGSERRLQL